MLKPLTRIPVVFKTLLEIIFVRVPSVTCPYFKCRSAFARYLSILSLVHENGGYWYVLADKGVQLRLWACFSGQCRAVRHCPPKHATQLSPWREMAEDAVFWRPMACSPPFPPKPANVGNLYGGQWRFWAGARLVPPLPPF